MAKNPRLKRRIETRMEVVRKLQRESGKAVRQFEELRYQRDTWSCERRMVAKVEHLPRGENPRYIVTSGPVQECDGQRLYEEIYCARGNIARLPGLERSTVAATSPLDGVTSRTPWKSVRSGAGSPHSNSSRKRAT